MQEQEAEAGHREGDDPDHLPLEELAGVVDGDLIQAVGEAAGIKPAVHGRVIALAGAAHDLAAGIELLFAPGAEEEDGDVFVGGGPPGDCARITPADAAGGDVAGKLRIDLRLAAADVFRTHIDPVHQDLAECREQKVQQDAENQADQVCIKHLRPKRTGEGDLLNQSDSPFPRRCG